MATLRKVFLVTNIPNPYRIPLFNELNRQLMTHQIQLKVIFGSSGYRRRRWDIDLKECEFSFKILHSHKFWLRNPEKTIFTYRGLWRELRKERPDLLIISGFSFAAMKALMQYLLENTPFMIWSGAISNEYQRDSFLRTLQRKMLISRASGFVAYGSQARDYLCSLGAPESRVRIAINTVDTAFFKEKVREVRGKEIPNGRKHLTYVGELSNRKNVMRTLEVIELMAKQRQDFLFDIVGDGPEKPVLQGFACDNGLADIVSFHGFVQRDNLPPLLAKSSCFLFQTEFDIWGLVLVEAMAAGVPCIASRQAGATSDLIQNGFTGFVADFSEIQEVANRINWLLDNPRIARQIGRNAASFVGEHVSIEKSASGIVEAIVTL